MAFLDVAQRVLRRIPFTWTFVGLCIMPRPAPLISKPMPEKLNDQAYYRYKSYQRKNGSRNRFRAVSHGRDDIYILFMRQAFKTVHYFVGILRWYRRVKYANGVAVRHEADPQ
jgi:hypothetical protein